MHLSIQCVRHKVTTPYTTDGKLALNLPIIWLFLRMAFPLTNGKCFTPATETVLQHLTSSNPKGGFSFGSPNENLHYPSSSFEWPPNGLHYKAFHLKKPSWFPKTTACLIQPQCINRVACWRKEAASCGKRHPCSPWCVNDFRPTWEGCHCCISSSTRQRESRER